MTTAFRLIINSQAREVGELMTGNGQCLETGSKAAIKINPD